MGRVEFVFVAHQSSPPKASAGLRGGCRGSSSPARFGAFRREFRAPRGLTTENWEQKLVRAFVTSERAPPHFRFTLSVRGERGGKLRK